MEPSLEYLEDWEEWNPESGTSFLVHAAAGSLAGAAEHCVMFPFDTIKTYSQAAGSKNSFAAFNQFLYSQSQRLTVTQSHSAPRTTLNGQVPIPQSMDFIRNYDYRYQYSRFTRPWRGVSTMLTACIPAHALYFSIFEASKSFVHSSFSKTAVSSSSSSDLSSNLSVEAFALPVATGLCGVVATLAHDSIMTPMDVIKQRMQLGLYRNLPDALKSVWKSDGIKGLFISYPTTLLMNIPYAAVMVATNESVKMVLNPNNKYNVSAFVIAGGAAGAVAAAMTNPLDVVKTRLQTQNILQIQNNLECSNADALNLQKHVVSNASNANNSHLKVGRFFDKFFSVGRGGINGLNGVNGVNSGYLTLRYSYYYTRVGSAGNALAKCLCFPYRSKGSGTGTQGTTTMTCPYNKQNKNGCLCEAKINNTEKSSRGFSTVARPSESPKALRYSGFLEAVKTIFAEEGYRGFTRGVKARVMMHAPSVAISWTTYETAKKILQHQS